MNCTRNACNQDPEWRRNFQIGPPIPEKIRHDARAKSDKQSQSKATIKGIRGAPEETPGQGKHLLEHEENYDQPDKAGLHQNFNVPIVRVF